MLNVMKDKMVERKKKLYDVYHFTGGDEPLLQACEALKK